MSYYDRSQKVLMQAYGRFDITLDHGSGAYLYDVNGKEYLDFYAGIGVNSFGTNYPKYVSSLQQQLPKLMHVSNYFNTAEIIEAAELVLEAIEMDKIFFTNSGTEATEGALKLARKYYYLKHGVADSQIISLDHSFHGRSTGSLKLTGNLNYQKAFEPLIPGVSYGKINDLESIEKLINPKVCGIILEPVQGEGGLSVCHKDFLQGLRKLCDKYDIALIFDEVQCGMGRTGTIMTYFQYGIKPDIVCMAKGLGAGFPVGAFAANAKFSNVMQPGDHGSTYGGNPLAGLVVSTVMRILKEDNILEHVQEISKYLHKKLQLLKSRHSNILEIKGLGLMRGLELNQEAKPIMKACIKKGLIVVTAGTNVIRMLPPFIITEKEVDLMFEIMDQVLNEF